MSDKEIPERVWVAGYTAGDMAGTLSRGLYFRSIHDSREDAEQIEWRYPSSTGFTVTEYVSAESAESRVRELEQALQGLVGSCTSSDPKVWKAAFERAVQILSALHVADKAAQK